MRPRPVGVSGSSPPLRLPIGVVVILCSQKEVVGPHADRIVAFVQDVQTFWYFTVC